eukprot:snap_masked-scaffold_11-processed-gene-2.7-mRNA-1 protein AED:1.00 eAED:1.00 QI:0/0/0/0/1/1/2/0/61
MVVQHFTIFSRPSTTEEGVVVFEDKHDPVIRFDLPVFVSCLFGKLCWSGAIYSYNYSFLFI